MPDKKKSKKSEKLRLSKESRFKPLPLARKALANRLYSTISPDVYGDEEVVKEKIGDFIQGTPREVTQDQYSEDAWAKYLGLEQPGGSLTRSETRPSVAKNKRAKYHRLPDEFEQNLLKGYQQNKEYIQFEQEDLTKMPMSEMMMPGSSGSVLGNFTVGEGVDEKTGQKYLSYYDKYDIAPNPAEGVVGKPFEIYNRIPLPDEKMANNNLSEFETGGWMKDAIDPAHKGYCTPMSKATCTPHRKAFARRAKAGEFNKEDGGSLVNDTMSQFALAVGGGQQGGGEQLDLMGVPEYGFGSWLKDGGGGGILAQAGLGAATGAATGAVAGGVGAIPGAVIGFAGGLIKGIGKNRKRKREEAAAEEEQARMDEQAAAFAESGRQENLALRSQNIVNQDQASYSATFEEGGSLGNGLMENNTQKPVITEYSKKANNHNEGVGGIPVDAKGNPATVSNGSVVGLTEAGEVTWNGYVFSDKLKVNKK